MKGWLDLHRVNAGLVQDIIAAYGSFGLSADLPEFTEAPLNCMTYVLPDLPQTYRELIIPAFREVFSPEASILDLLSSVIFKPFTDDTGNVPHTVDMGEGQAPVIVMDWQGSLDDLTCLAHEAAHALQVLLSDHALMPPVARETCAFLGELILIGHVRQTNRELFSALSQVWYNENEAYLGRDMDVLSDSLQNPEAQYHYRLNYPIARLAAAQIYRNTEKSQLLALFSSGGNAMAQLPLESMANKAGEASNYLPPMPSADPDNPATDAYRALGAVTLLDIDYWQGESEGQISDYYDIALEHLKNCTAFVALNELQKPVGYVTWRKSSPSAPVILTRQAAPFGDHLMLQKAVERHLQRSESIFAQHRHSARKEQMAW